MARATYACFFDYKTNDFAMVAKKQRSKNIGHRHLMEMLFSLSHYPFSVKTRAGRAIRGGLRGCLAVTWSYIGSCSGDLGAT